jgi:hypothetical protein
MIPTSISLMKTSKALPASLTALLFSTFSASAAVVYDFDSEGLDDYFDSAVTGWTQDAANMPGFSGDPDIPHAYVSTLNFGSGPSQVGFLGTRRANTADGSPVTIAGSLASSGTLPVPGRISLNLAILDDATDNFAGRDAFTIAVTDTGSSDLAVIHLNPDPSDLILWDISVGVNGGTLATTSASLQAQGGYLLTVDFNSLSTVFSLASSSPGSSNVAFSTLDAVPAADLGEIKMTLAQPGVGTSATGLAFDNITIVPEPSTAILFSSAFLGLFLRRRK